MRRHLLTAAAVFAVAIVIVVYVATIVGGCLGCDDEGLEARFFETTEIPWDDLAFRSTREALREFLAGELAPQDPVG